MNRVKTDTYSQKKLVLNETIRGEVVTLKSGQNIELGNLLIMEEPGKFVKYVKATHKDKLASSILRVYVGIDTVNASSGDVKVRTLRSGELDKSLVKFDFKTPNLDADDYKLIGELERLGIFIKEVR